MTSPLFRKEAVDYHKNKNVWGDALIKVPNSLSLWAYTCLFLIATSIVILANNTYDRKLIAKGHLLPKDGLISIYAKSKPGTIKEILVSDGGSVTKGDKLIAISTLRTSEDDMDTHDLLLSELDSTLKLLEYELATNKKLSVVKIDTIKTQNAGIAKEIHQASRAIEVTRRQFNLSKSILTKNKSLNEKNVLSDLEFQAQQKAHLDLTLKLFSLESELVKLENQFAQNKLLLSKLPLDMETTNNTVLQSISETKQKIINVSGERSYALFAPTSGTITSLKANIGRAIEPNARVAVLMPEDSQLHAELFVPTTTMAFIKIGQTVNIRYAAYPYQRYGLHRGVITKITNAVLSPQELPDTLIGERYPSYKVTVELDRQSIKAFGNEEELHSGMLLEADIIIESISFLDWALEPLYQKVGKQ